MFAHSLFYLTHRWDPIRCFHSASEWIWKQWQWIGTLNSQTLQDWSLTIRLFSVIIRTLLGGYLSVEMQLVYSIDHSRLGSSVLSVCVCVCSPMYFVSEQHIHFSQSKWRCPDKTEQWLKTIQFIITLFRVTCRYTVWQYSYALSIGGSRPWLRKCSLFHIYKYSGYWCCCRTESPSPNESSSRKYMVCGAEFIL